MNMTDQIIIDDKDKSAITADSYEVDVNDISNPVLKRLIEEVRYESQNKLGMYNRTHNRHNRGR